MTLTSAAVRPAPLHEPLKGKIVEVLGNPQTKCHWRVQQLSPGDDAITFCHHPDGINTSDTPWLQNLTVGSEVTYKRTTASTTRPGEFVGQLIAAAPQESPEQTTSGRSEVDQAEQGLMGILETLPDPATEREELASVAPPDALPRDAARRRIAKEALKEDLFLGRHHEQDIKGLWYLVRRKTHRIEVSRQPLEWLATRFDVLKPGEVLATEITTEEN